MKKLSIFILVVFCAFVKINAQEEDVFKHAQMNPILINPATAGADAEHHKVFMNVRRAWTNFPGTPTSYALSYNGPIGKRLGIGAMLFTENVAAITRYRAQLSYAFRYQIKDFNLALGLSTEYHRMRLTNEVLEDPLYMAGDESISAAMDGIKVFDASLGVFVSHNLGTYFGISLPSLVSNKLDEISGEESGSFLNNFTVLAGHRFDLKESNFSIEPSVLVKKISNVDLQADIGFRAGFLKDRILSGLIYRTGTGGSLAILLGTKYNNLKFLYSYDVYFDDFQSYNGGSHEVTFAFEFDRKEGKFDRSKKYRK